MAVDFPPPASGYSAVTLTEDGTPVRVATRKTETLKIEPRVVKRNDEVVTYMVAVPGSVEVREGKLVLWTNRFFQGHTTRLLITLKPLR